MPEISTLSVISAAIVSFTRPSRLKHVFHDLPHIVSRNVYHFVNLFSYIAFFHGKRFPFCFQWMCLFTTYDGVLKMKRIMLCCSAGMSTSLLMRKMKEAASARGLDVEIAAYAAHEFDEQVGNYDVVLLGPQVKYMLASFQEKAEEKGVPVAAIDMMDYGMQRGDNVLDFAFSLIEKSGQPL